MGEGEAREGQEANMRRIAPVLLVIFTGAAACGTAKDVTVEKVANLGRWYPDCDELAQQYMREYVEGKKPTPGAEANHQLVAEACFTLTDIRRRACVAAVKVERKFSACKSGLLVPKKSAMCRSLCEGGSVLNPLRCSALGLEMSNGHGQ
jgi:hypothetical protein